MANDLVRTQVVDIQKALEARTETFIAMLPAHVSVDRFKKSVIVAVMNNPKLLSCERTSLFQAVTKCCQLGLDPSGVLGSAYIIPYGNKATFVPGYQGLLDLARRSGQIAAIQARIVRHGDQFSYHMGDEERIEHIPALDAQTVPELRFVYAIGKLKDGTFVREVMNKAQIDVVKNTALAKSYNKAESPWTKHYDEMARKTVIRRICKFLPMTPELAEALDLDAPQHGEISADAIMAAIDDSTPQSDDAIEQALNDAMGEDEEPAGRPGPTPVKAEPLEATAPPAPRTTSPKAAPAPVVTAPPAPKVPPKGKTIDEQELGGRKARAAADPGAIPQQQKPVNVGGTVIDPVALRAYNESLNVLKDAEAMKAVNQAEADGIRKDLFTAYQNSDLGQMENLVAQVNSSVAEMKQFEAELAAGNVDEEPIDTTGQAVSEDPDDETLRMMTMYNNAIEEARASGKFSPEELAVWRTRMLESTSKNNMKLMQQEIDGLRGAVSKRSSPASAEPAVAQAPAAGRRQIQPEEIAAGRKILLDTMRALGKATKIKLMAGSKLDPELWAPCMGELLRDGVVDHEGERAGRHYFEKTTGGVAQEQAATAPALSDLTKLYDYVDNMIKEGKAERWLSGAQVAMYDQRMKDAMQESDLNGLVWVRDQVDRVRSMVK